MTDSGARGRSPWYATPFIAIATFLGLYGLSTMLIMGPWMRTVGVVLLTATAVLVITRLLSRSRILPTVLAALGSAVVMVPLFARDEEGAAHLLPTPGALADLGSAIRGGVDYAAVTVAPAPEALPLTALITAAAVALLLVAEHIAVSWRAAATAGLLLLIPWLPAVIFQHRVSTVALLVAIVAWLAALALARRTAGGESRPALAGAFTATAATMGGVLLVAPTALGGLGWGAIPRIDPPSDIDTATRLNLALDLRTSLTTNSTSPVIVYETEGSRPDTFKLYALTDFDGVAWSREETEPTSISATSGVLWSEPVPDWTDRDLQRIDVQILNVPESNLPLPPSPRTVAVDGPWFYDPDRDEVVGDDVTTQNLGYSVVTDLRYTSPERLREIPANGGDGLDPRYLAISPAIDATRVTSLASQVTEEADTRYDQALAIQQFLRDTTQFTYDTSVNPTSGDTVSTFLDDRAGYCVQFATTMVMMARSLDIPARMAVGFLSGRVTEADTYLVEGGDAHAWPELWFPGEGWVRFEPTPAQQTGTPPSYADPYINQPPVREEILNGEADPLEPLQPELPDESLTGGDASTTEETSPVVSWWVLAGAGVLLVAAALGAWWLRVRGRSRTRTAHGPEQVWSRLRARLPEPLQWSTALTPHEATEHLEDGMRALDSGLSGQAREDLTRLANAVADARYAPDGSTAGDEDLRAWAERVASEAREAERAMSARQRTTKV